MKKIFCIYLCFFSLGCGEALSEKYEEASFLKAVEELDGVYATCPLLRNKPRLKSKPVVEIGTGEHCGQFEHHLIVFIDKDGHYICSPVKYTIAHEILHSYGMEHGKEFDEILDKCVLQRVASFFL